ncbi:MAG: maleylpyruvate isomerase N-terminal domain-containing protein [Candidatus Dormibacteria bacterium]
MHEVRLAFLAAAGAARPILGLPEVLERWEEPSALARMSIGALAAHLARAVSTVETYLDKNVRHSGEEPMSAAGYYAAVVSRGGSDLDSEANVAVRERADKAATGGGRSVLEGFEKSLTHLRGRLGAEPDDRLVEVYGNYVLPLDEYLTTRVIELTLHTDDLCVSVGHATPTLPGVEATIATLVAVAEIRHGEVAVLRALARRERDDEKALRVL